MVDEASFLRTTQTATEKLGATKEKKGMTSGEAISKCSLNIQQGKLEWTTFFRLFRFLNHLINNSSYSHHFLLQNSMSLV